MWIYLQGSRAVMVALLPCQVNVSFLQIHLLRRSTIVNLYLLVEAPGGLRRTDGTMSY